MVEGGAEENLGSFVINSMASSFGCSGMIIWPPHFHAVYGEDEAKIDIRTLEVIEGWLPGRALGLVLEWAQEHRAELSKDWDYAQ